MVQFFCLFFNKNFSYYSVFCVYSSLFTKTKKFPYFVDRYIDNRRNRYSYASLEKCSFFNHHFYHFIYLIEKKRYLFMSFVNSLKILGCTQYIYSVYLFLPNCLDYKSSHLSFSWHLEYCMWTSDKSDR